MTDRHLFLFFRDELKLANSKKSASVCKKNGVISPNDFAGLTEYELVELFETLKAAGIVLGDRSKLRKASAEDVTKWRAALEAKRKPIKKVKSQKSSLQKEEEQGLLGSRPGVTGTLKGAPAWWRTHDMKVRKMAIASTSKSKGGYAWQNVDDVDDLLYTQGLWKRRGEILGLGKLKDNKERREEWLALTFALDQSIPNSPSQPSSPQSSTQEDGDHDHPGTPKKPSYSWQSMRGETGFAAILLSRRKEMLKMDLTESQVLQFEWVELVRELEKLAYRSPVHGNLKPSESAGGGSGSGSNGGPSGAIARRRSKERSTAFLRDWSPPTPTSSPGSPRNPAISRILFSDTPRKRDESNYSDLSRAVSLASFYSEADSEGTNGFMTCEEAWYSQADSTDYATDDDVDSIMSSGNGYGSRYGDAESGSDSALETCSIGSPDNSSPMSSSEKLADQAKRYGPIVLGLGSVETEARKRMLDSDEEEDVDSVEGGSGGTGASGSGGEAAQDDLVMPTCSVTPTNSTSSSPVASEPQDAMGTSKGGLGATSISLVSLPIAAN